MVLAILRAAISANTFSRSASVKKVLSGIYTKYKTNFFVTLYHLSDMWEKKVFRTRTWCPFTFLVWIEIRGIAKFCKAALHTKTRAPRFRLTPRARFLFVYLSKGRAERRARSTYGYTYSPISSLTKRSSLNHLHLLSNRALLPSLLETRIISLLHLGKPGYPWSPLNLLNMYPRRPEWETNRQHALSEDCVPEQWRYSCSYVLAGPINPRGACRQSVG